MPTVKEQHEVLIQKSGELAAIFEKHKKGEDYDMPVEVIEEVNRRNDELTEIGKKYDELRAVDDIAKATAQRHAALKEVQRPEFDVQGQKGHQRGVSGYDMPEMKSLGQQVTESKSFKDRGENLDFKVKLPGFDTKTLMTTSAGFDPFVTRGPRIVDFPLRRPVIADFIPQTTIEADGVKYMEETTNTNNADFVAEGAEKPESAIAWTERSEMMQVIATTLPVTEQQLKFVPMIRGLIDNRLSMHVLLKEEDALLNGTGVSPQIQGFLTKTGVQTQAKGPDPAPDAVYKAFTKIRNTPGSSFAEPSLVIFHPNDWQDIRLLRTADGLYIWGNPSEAGPERIWGKPIVQTTAMTENTALTGDFALYSEIYRASGIIVETGWVNDQFKKNQVTIRAEEYVLLAIYMAAAFAKITGL